MWYSVRSTEQKHTQAYWYITPFLDLATCPSFPLSIHIRISTLGLTTFIFSPSLPPFTPPPPYRVSGIWQCAICYAPVDSALEDYMLTPCDHVFHQGCLTRWMDIKMECPTCRRELPPALES